MGSPELQQYKKSWLIGTMIARELTGFSPDDRLPTIAEYTQRLNTSRGLVQNAIKLLQDEKAVFLEKRGKIGTFITQLDLEKLFALGNLEFLTASMVPPLNKRFAGLATGICASIANCPVPFNFSFMHSSESRAKMLDRMAYDFIIVSYNAALELVKKYSRLSIAMKLDDALYGPPFILCSNRGGIREIRDGDCIAADPRSNDQYSLTLQLCKGKKVTILEESYLGTRVAFDEYKADFVLLRQDELEDLKTAVEFIPMENSPNRDITIPAVLVNKDNYYMDQIVQRYLNPKQIGEVQKAVMQDKRRPAFY